MYLSQKLIQIYPDLANHPEYFINGTIVLQNDGNGTYIKIWNYSEPQPTLDQLDGAS